jgi:predicted transcriptional regulator
MRRTEIEIVVAILEVAGEPINKTAIVYKTNINFKIAKKYLDTLQANGLIEKKPENKYRITDKGKSYLQKAKELSQFIGTSTS